MTTTQLPSRPARARVQGHSLTLRWSGERGRESLSNGVCMCGWEESGGSAKVVRDEYAYHLDRAWLRLYVRSMSDADLAAIDVDALHSMEAMIVSGERRSRAIREAKAAMSASLSVYRPTVKRPPPGDPCSGCANAGPRDEFGGFECRLLDDQANIDDDERELADAVAALWSGDDPGECPGWAEPPVEVCEKHGAFRLADGCGGCEFESGSEPWEVPL